MPSFRKCPCISLSLAMQQREWLVKKNEDVKYFILASGRVSVRRSISAPLVQQTHHYRGCNG